MHWIWATILLLSIGGQPETGTQPAPRGDQTRPPAGPRVGVLTFNIRYGTAPDKENGWPHRKDQVFAILNDERLDFAGLQEALRGQLDDIHAACPKLGEVGVGR